jgi:solute carrier family 12 (sodium/potassium/chloride transporter), member 2
VSDQTQGHGFGTAPVFLASICTILGAVMFLRFGYAVGHLGVAGALGIILIGHLVTIPTALAIAELATNRKVEGGGEYFIISRSFGVTIGAAIGASLYASQAISVAFYMIAFAESFTSLAPQWTEMTGLPWDPRFVSIPATLALIGLMLTKGADLGVKALWLVFVVLVVALVMFFAGSPLEGAQEGISLGRLEGGDNFNIVFAIVFPAFTGMTAGVGLSGDLANPRRSIPLGSIAGTVVGMLVYVAIVFKLASSATPEQLASDPLIMGKIAVWGPIIPIGLACATISSAIGSILVAPRTMQALAGDGAFPSKGINAWLSKGTAKSNEPRNATIVTSVLALVVVALGNVDIVARLVSMFFMVTYGTLCAISFLEHFAANPSYRPSFRSKWYLSGFGALACLFMMFQMDPVFAFLAIVILVVIYRYLSSIRGDERDDLAAIFAGVMSQATRFLQIRIQRADVLAGRDWRPSIIMVSGRTFDRRAPIQFLEWLCWRHGFGTYLHFVRGFLGPETHTVSEAARKQVISAGEARDSTLYLDTIVSPSMRSALAQSLQLPGVSGLPNNSVLSEFSVHDEAEVHQEVVDACSMAGSTRMNGLVLRHGDQFFGNHQSIHVWLTHHDYENAHLMVLLAYILLGHPSWTNAEIRIFAAVPRQDAERESDTLNELIETGRLPITSRNLEIIPTDARGTFEGLVHERSHGADLVIMGFTQPRLADKGAELLLRHSRLHDVLFVNAQEQILVD